MYIVGRHFKFKLLKAHNLADYPIVRGLSFKVPDALEQYKSVTLSFLFLNLARFYHAYKLYFLQSIQKLSPIPPQLKIWSDVRPNYNMIFANFP